MSHESIQTHNRLIKPSALVLSALFMAAAFETTATLNDKKARPSEPDVIPHLYPGAERATIYVPGFHADGEVIGPMYLPTAERNRSNLFVVAWDKSGNRPDIAKEKLAESFDSSDDSPLAVHVSSWGFHPWSDWMADPQFRERLNLANREVTVVSDSSFYDVSDISKSTRRAMHATRFLPPTFTPAKLFEFAMGFDNTDTSIHDENVTTEQIEAWRKSSKKAPYGAARSQVTDISSRLGYYPGMTEAYENVDKYRFVSAWRDDVADPYTSFAKMRRKIGEDKSAHFIDKDRPDPSHAMGPALSETIAKLLYCTDDELEKASNIVRLTPRPIPEITDGFSNETYELALAG